MGTPRPTDPLGAEWVLLLFVVLIGTLAWVNAISPRKWELLRTSVLRLRLGRQTMREDLNLRDRTLIALLAAGCISMGLFLHQAGVHFGWLRPAWWLAIELMAVLFAAMLAQLLLLRVATIVFRADGGAQEYGFTQVLLLIANGLVLVPLDLLMACWPSLRTEMLLAGMLLTGVLLVLRWVRAVAIGNGSGTGRGYVFLYLCALEILPFALLISSLQQALPPDVRPH